jgi:DNA mismatch repair ATPase MutS
MLIDSTTLSDLEVFATPDGGTSVIDLIDRTLTSRGHAALHRRFQRPAHDTRTIKRAQEAVAFLARHPGIVNIDEVSVAGVTRYLRSNIALSLTSSVGARLEYAWMSLRYHDLAKELETGIAATERLFVRVLEVCSRLIGLNARGEVAELVGRLDAMALEVVDICRGPGALLKKDRTLRIERRDRILEAVDVLGELDALNAMASATSAFGWVVPEVIESDVFVLEVDGLVHPFVEQPVPNPAYLSGGEPMVFLTGPNMAGKTTYLRSVALVVLFAQVGMGVPAKGMRWTPVEALFTSLSPTDNLKAGLSYFLAEVLRVKAAATLLAEGRRTLILFDEVFKGTNVRDALDASAEVILGFAKARRSGIIFSSHLAELVQVLEVNPRIRFCYFDGDIVEGRPSYPYELKEGVSEKRFGLLLLRQAEVPELIERIA